jgi:hypothetical protein
VKIGFITEDQMVNALTQECWVPHLKVDKYEIRKKALDTVAREDALHFGVFPVDKLGSLLTLAMVNPLDAETIRVLESKTGLDVKKVVATRTEIAQGIEKYYSGAVVAQDTSRSFTQDVEPKSVTQMLGKVAPSLAPPSRPMPVVSAPPPSPAPVSAPSDNIVPEIQDIDDLLSSDEAIAPAIIEPISIKAEAEVVPMEPEFEPVMDEPVISAPKPPPARKAPSAEFQLGDSPFAEPTPALNKKVAPAPSIAPEFEFESPSIASPSTKPPAVQPPSRPAPPQAAPAARSAPPIAPPPTSSFSRPADAPKTATSRFSGTARSEKAGVINLIPVTEEEFQHAITHGKSHVFEKWIGLQSRNRIINAVAIDSEFDRLLAGLYASPRRV